MKRFQLLALLLAAGLLAGCKDSKPAATPAPSSASASDQMSLATHAQPRLPTIKLYIGAQVLDAEQALTPREQMTGMMFRTNIPDSDSMLFVFPGPFKASFWMKNCPTSISAAYIDPNGMIQEIHHLQEEDTNPVVAASGNIQFVLETSDGWFKRHHIGVGTEIRTEKGSLQQTYFPNQQ